MLLLRTLLCSICCCCLFTLSAQTIRGQLLDAISGAQLIGATVSVVGQNEGTTTDEKGEFRIINLIPGIYQLEIRFLGYQSIIVPELEIGKGREQVLQLSLTPTVRELSPAIVRASRADIRNTVVPVSTLTVDATERMPATFFDPARMAAYLPGTSQQNDQANGVSVRGNSPNQTSWRLNGLDIVNPNHLTNAGTFSDRPSSYGGGTNALSAQVMDYTRFYRGNQPYYVGNVNAGLFDVELRRGNVERQQYALQAGLIGLDATAEGPFTSDVRSTYLINTRYSFTGLLADLGVDFGGEEISFSDVNINLSFPLGANGKLDLFGLIGASDNLFTPSTDSTAWEDEKSLFDQISYENNLAIAGMRLSLPVSKKGHFHSVIGYSEATTNRHSESQDVRVAEEELDERQESKFSTNFSYHHRFGNNTQLSAGSELTFREFSSRSRFVQNGTMQHFSEYSGWLIQPFANWHQQAGSFSYDLGLHTTRWQFDQATFLEPRLNLSYQFRQAGRLTLALGQYSQLPSMEISTTRNRKLIQSQHIDLNWQKPIGQQARLEIALFMQEHQKLIVSAEAADDFSSFNLLEQGRIGITTNSGIARTGGLEISFEKFAGQDWFLMANATLFTSRYRGSDLIWRDSRFAQDYLANLIIGREWVKQRDEQRSRRLGIQIGIHTAGGSPIRPLDVAASRFINQSVYVQNEGFSQQLSSYFRTDLRIYLTQDRKQRTSILSLDIQNVMNIENDAYVYWDRLLEAPTLKKQLGIIPVLNWRLEFGK